MLTNSGSHHLECLKVLLELKLACPLFFSLNHSFDSKIATESDIRSIIYLRSKLTNFK